MSDRSLNIPETPDRPDVEIEAPTSSQRQEGIVAEAVRMASHAEYDSGIVAYLVGQKMPKEEARGLLQEIRERARPEMEKRFAARRAVGYFFIFAALVCATYAWLQDPKSIPAFIIALFPLFVGIGQIKKNRTPEDSELGIDT